MDAETTHQPDEQTWTARLDGRDAGTLEYELVDDALVITHTVVDPRFGRRGVGSELVRSAVADARARGLRVRPLCSFAAAWFDAHPDEADLVGA